MSIPLDRLYHYIESVAQDVYGDTVIYHFYPHGSKKLEDLKAFSNVNTIHALSPEIICYDQEPLNYDLYQNSKVRIQCGEDSYGKNIQNLISSRNLRNTFINIYDKCILLHSEQNSKEVTKYQNNQFIPVYYWSHAIIALDWFRYAQYYYPKKNVDDKKFLIYNRAWTGTREYRLKFIDMLIDNNLLSSCKTWTNIIDPDSGVYYKSYKYSNSNWIPHNILENYVDTTLANSSCSADFDMNDYDNCDIEVILETLFDDQRIHLTEKVLRSIAVGKPFILASGHESLKYLKRYGFKTFDNIIDESYDNIVDPVERMQKIIKLMKHLDNLPDVEYRYKLDQLQEIANYNKKHFFSKDFINYVINELKTNLYNGLQELEVTNTSTTFINLRREYGNSWDFQQYRHGLAKLYGYEHVKNLTKLTLIKARKYYNRFHNK